METIKSNLLQSIIRYNEVTSNQGNEYTLLESLRSSLQIADPGILDRSDAAVRCKTKCDDNQPALKNPIAVEKGTNKDQIQDQPRSTDVSDIPPAYAELSRNDINLQELQKNIYQQNSNGIQLFNKRCQ